MVFALVFCFVWILAKLPEGVSTSDALYLAGSLDKLQALDLKFDLSEKYNLWSGALAGIFLMLSYFGCDQTQVQRYLTARSEKEASNSLLLSAFAKVPMQFFILLLGVLLYVFYIFHESPLTFRPVMPEPSKSELVKQGQELKTTFHDVHEKRRQAALELLTERQNMGAKETFRSADAQIIDLRKKEFARIEKLDGARYNDTNYIIPFFISKELPVGIIGLIFAGIFAAALSSIDSTLNSLSTVFIIDWYQRLHRKPRPEVHYVRASRMATIGWGRFRNFGSFSTW